MSFLNILEEFNGRVISTNDDVIWPPRSCDLTQLGCFFSWVI